MVYSLSTVAIDMSCVQTLEKLESGIFNFQDKEVTSKYGIIYFPQNATEEYRQITKDGCYKESKLSKGINTKGTYQSDWSFTKYFTPRHELTTINVCNNDDGSLRGLQFQVGVHNSTIVFDRFNMFGYGNMLTDPKSIRSCYSDYILDDISIRNATIFWNTTQVVGLNFLYSTGETRRYGNITYAMFADVVAFNEEK